MNWEDITESQFRQYVTVQRSGAFNMMTRQARTATGLSAEEYFVIIGAYDKLSMKYIKV